MILYNQVNKGKNMTNNHNFNAHQFQQYTIQKDFLENLEREINVDISRSFRDGVDDIFYDGANFEFSDTELDLMLETSMPKKEKNNINTFNTLSKLRKRILGGPKSSQYGS